MHREHSSTTESSTDNVLVVLDADDPDATLRAVVPELDGSDASDAELHLLAVFPTTEYEHRRHARLDAGVSGPYTLEHLAEEARRIARRVGREYLAPDGFEAMGAVGGTCDCIRAAVDEHDYGQVYVADEPRPTWQRILGSEDLSTELTRVLPDVVSVVPLMKWWP